MRQLYYTLQTLIRGKGSNLIKIISLGLGLAVSILIFSRQAFELNYDTCYKDHERLCLVKTVWYYNNEYHPSHITLGPVAGTIAENLRWGNKDATDAEIEEACKQACADEFIERFPDKYNTHIDQGGTNVSGGQKQRLCIARALLKKPRILILDDSTSAVDTGTDAKIRKSFAEKIPGTTVFIIAQRISSVENADHVIVLDNGRISGYGTPAEMLATNPIYQEVYNSQTKGSGDFDEKGGDNNG